MIILKENDRVYVAETIYPYFNDGRADQLLVPENMPIFRAKSTKVIIAGTETSFDSLRYERLPFHKELSQETIVNTLMPKIKTILCNLGKDDEDGNIAPLVFAKDNKAFIAWPDGKVMEIETEYVIGAAHEDLCRYSLACTKGMPLKRRLQVVYQTVGKLAGVNLFPLIMMDTKSLKVQVIEEEQI